MLTEGAGRGVPPIALLDCPWPWSVNKLIPPRTARRVRYIALAKACALPSLQNAQSHPGAHASALGHLCRIVVIQTWQRLRGALPPCALGCERMVTSSLGTGSGEGMANQFEASRPRGLNRSQPTVAQIPARGASVQPNHVLRTDYAAPIGMGCIFDSGLVLAQDGKIQAVTARTVRRNRGIG